MKRAPPPPLAASPRALRDWPLPVPGEGEDKEARGRVLVLGGSRTVPGAPLLAGEAALRAGAGKLQVGAPAEAAIALGVALPEARVVGMATDRSGNPTSLPKALLQDVADADAVLVGPGMTSTPGSTRFAAAVLRAARATCVVDAGALGVLAKRRPAHGLIATPHWGEMASMCGRPIGEIAADPARFARDAAARLDAVVVLKGATTFIASPEGRLWRHAGGGVGLGTSGSGDVLAGLIAGLVARGAGSEQAALWGVCVHGMAGRRLARRVGRVGFLARELAVLFPGLLESAHLAR